MIVRDDTFPVTFVVCCLQVFVWPLQQREKQSAYIIHMDFIRHTSSLCQTWQTDLCVPVETSSSSSRWAPIRVQTRTRVSLQEEGGLSQSICLCRTVRLTLLVLCMVYVLYMIMYWILYMLESSLFEQLWQTVSMWWTVFIGWWGDVWLLDHLSYRNESLSL